MANPLTKIPKFRRCVLQNFPFIEQDFDALTDYQLLCKVVEYLNKVITSQNAVIDVAESLTTAFNELQSFVTNYFDNLDVQEEINNKLDDMAEAGTLQEIITAYIQSNVAWCFDTVADMKAATNLVAGSYAQTLGFHTINDGGGAIYYITDSGTANEMDIIAIGDLYANLVYDNEVNVKKLGAIGDNSNDDTSALVRAFTLNYPVYIPRGRYILKEAITITNRIVRGDGQFATKIKATNDISGNVITLGSDHIKIKDLTIESPDYDYSVVGTANENTGIYINDYHHITMENVRIVGFNYGIYARRAWCLSCYDVMCLCCNKGLYGIDEFNNTLFERCIFNTCIVAFHFQGGFGNLFNACDFEKNTDGVFTDSKGDLTFDGCYFENNTSSALHIGWGLNPINAITINSSTFWVNAQCDGLIKYHARPDTPIVLRDCTFRNNDTLEAGSKPIFIKEHSTQCLPHIIGGEIGASFSVLDDIWVDKLGAKALTPTDWITAGENITIGNFALYEDNKHIFGWVSFTSTTAYPAGTATTLGVLKDKYKPAVNVNSYGVLTDNQWQQTSDNLCYLYISGPSIQTRDGDGTCKTIKAYIDYVRK